MSHRKFMVIAYAMADIRHAAALRRAGYTADAAYFLDRAAMYRRIAASSR